MNLPTGCKYKFDEEFSLKIIEMFQNGMNVTAISREVSIPYRTINNFLIENNIKEVKHCKLSDEKISCIIKMIKAGIHVSEISRTVGSTYDTIKNLANENGLELLEFKMPRSEKNANFVDDYFSVINTEEKAYYLGLIYTDGYVRIHNGGYFLGIQLKRSDESVIKKLAKELKCGNDFYYCQRQTNIGLGDFITFETCNSKQLFDDLAVFDVVPNKTYNSESFKNIKEKIPRNLIRHFLRGLVDGDGTIVSRKKHNKVIAVYQNSEKFCQDFNSLLKESYGENNFKVDISSHRPGMYQVRYRRINDIKKICGFLYKDATIFLQRKYDIAKEYFED